MSRDFIILKQYVGDGYFISRTCTHTTWNMAVSTEQNLERDGKNYLPSLDFDEIAEILVEEKTIEIFVQDTTAKNKSYI